MSKKMEFGNSRQPKLNSTNKLDELSKEQMSMFVLKFNF